VDITEANRVVGEYLVKRRTTGDSVPFEATAWGDKYLIKAMKNQAGKSSWKIERQSGKTGKTTEASVTVDSALFNQDYGYTAWRDIMKSAIDKLNEQGDVKCH
jgi:hypothetical protein